MTNLSNILSLNISNCLINSSCFGTFKASCLQALIIEEMASFLPSFFVSFFNSSSVNTSNILGIFS